MIFLNDIDKFVCQWMRNLIDAGEVPQGVVDERSITDIKPSDLAGYRQCHFFAGVAGWPYALRLAGWPESIPVWTGSCPCQPFSVAGQKKANADERHLWPAFYHLIRECRPQYVFGEQVPNAIRLGWLDGISADLEAAGYTVGATVLGAHSVGSPHIRQRLYWVAYARSSSPRHASKSSGNAEAERAEDSKEPASSITACRLADVQSPRRTGQKSQERRFDISCPWSDCRIIQCIDDKARRIGAERSVFPLANGVSKQLGSRFPELRRVLRVARSNRVGRIKAYGNAIVPQVAAVFVRAFMETVGIHLM